MQCMVIHSVACIFRHSYNLLEYLRTIVFSLWNVFSLNQYPLITIFNLVKHLIAKYGLSVTTTELQNFLISCFSRFMYKLITVPPMECPSSLYSYARELVLCF